MDDNRIINRCQAGDKEAFQELIAKYHPYVYRFLVKITDDEDISQDLTQETFIKVIRNIDKFDINGSAKFSTYIITLCRNCYIDYYRKSRKTMSDVLIDENLMADEAGIEEMVIDKELNQEVERELEQLPEEQRIAIRLKYIEGLTLKEIAEKMGVESKTIKSRIHNGIVKLRKIFDGRIG